VRRSDKVLDYEHRIIMLDGQIKHVHVVSHFVNDASAGIPFEEASTRATNNDAGSLHVELQLAQKILRSASAKSLGSQRRIYQLVRAPCVAFAPLVLAAAR
jgi:hypothetical protein